MVTPLAAVRDRLEAAGIPDAAFEAAQLYMLATGRDARLSGGAPLTAFEQKRLDALCEKRCARFPLQYLCGEWDFLDLTLKVGPGVLIPRADTETVAEAAIEATREAGPGAAVADLCSGTGAIALGVATHVPGARVTAVESHRTHWPICAPTMRPAAVRCVWCRRMFCAGRRNARRAALTPSCPTRRISRRRRWPGCSRSFSMSRAWPGGPGRGLAFKAYRACLFRRAQTAAVSF
ncbi:MAG: N5-glutamine methyltransferase family protein [Ruthenibacterium lactatiformans]